jgi:hypothetical protein
VSVSIPHLEFVIETPDSMKMADVGIVEDMGTTSLASVLLGAETPRRRDMRISVAWFEEDDCREFLETLERPQLLSRVVNLSRLVPLSIVSVLEYVEGRNLIARLMFNQHT